MANNSSRPRFARLPVLLVVVHAYTSEQVERNVAIALKAGADGVFLIAGKMDWRELSACYQKVRAQFAGAWIGLNFLDLNPEEAFESTPPGVNGLWVDNAGTQPDRNGVFYQKEP